jgi:rod shape-determining protein MreC
MVRRFTAAFLVLLSLALLTVYLREDDRGGLHGLQRFGLGILSPFEVAGERVARPFKDAYSYVSDLTQAKKERDQLAAEVSALKEQAAQAQAALAENARLEEVMSFVGRPGPTGYEKVATRILVRPVSPFDQKVLVAAGSADGVVKDSPVVDGNGQLVGLVTDVIADHESQVTLITDQTIRVPAIDVATGASGVLRPSPSGAGLLFDRVAKDERIRDGDTVITAGWKYANLSSLYPKWIPIGRITSAGQRDIDLFWQIQVDPLVDFDTLAEVVILVKR